MNNISSAGPGQSRTPNVHTHIALLMSKYPFVVHFKSRPHLSISNTESNGIHYTYTYTDNLTHERVGTRSHFHLDRQDTAAMCNSHVPVLPTGPG